LNNAFEGFLARPRIAGRSAGRGQGHAHEGHAERAEEEAEREHAP
jgi:hypothetical protein